ncbi:DMT family transporter [Kushneria aurantia]|uniref:DMT family transporter n=1 Tax=Kushneria aurantia TaxID=504092 RepID=A0ABV6G095_9GAMM|nr:DMT family transporter [Kushneria aurantia]
MTTSVLRGSFAPMTLFVLLWGSAPVITRWGLDHASPLAFLVLRFALALLALLAIGARYRRWLPPRGSRLRTTGTGLVLIGGYAVCYFRALDSGITPGLLATLLGIQPLLTLLLTERRFSLWRLAGLSLSLTGLALVVLESLLAARVSTIGMAFALGALTCMTLGAISQKRLQLPPREVLPLQYAVSLVLFLVLLPLEPMRLAWQPGLIVPVLWMALVVSVLAQLLLYRLIRDGNLVNVTSLFYLVPIVTAVLDYLILGNVLSPSALLGMAAILGGVAMVFGSHRRH